MYRWRDHTAEVELELEGRSEREVLSDALAALRELLEEGGEPPESGEPFGELLEEGGEPPESGEPFGAGHEPLERRTVRVVAADRPALLAAWLEELLFLSESEGFIPGRIEQLALSGDALAAKVAGWVGDPRPLVKAITYHRLEFGPCERGYCGRVVFDV